MPADRVRGKTLSADERPTAKQSASVAELREHIRDEDAELRQAMTTLDQRLEDLLDASHGRYAKASDKLGAALARILDRPTSRGDTK